MFRDGQCPFAPIVTWKVAPEEVAVETLLPENAPFVARCNDPVGDRRGKRTRTAAGRLIGKGFKPPERGFVNYWQDFDQARPRSLAQITEWAFREVFGEHVGFHLISQLAIETNGVMPPRD